MVDLSAMYAKAGLTLAGHELPDFLPAVLEFLSLRPEAEARELLEDCAHILRAIGERLLVGRSPYAAVFSALLDRLGETALSLPEHRPAEPQPSLDEEWAETPVEFGPNCAPHGAQQSRPDQQFIRFIPKREARESGAAHGIH